jgi:hypothetical protein
MWWDGPNPASNRFSVPVFVDGEVPAPPRPVPGLSLCTCLQLAKAEADPR